MTDYEIKVTRTTSFAINTSNMLKAQVQIKKILKDMEHLIKWDEEFEVKELELSNDEKD